MTANKRSDNQFARTVLFIKSVKLKKKKVSKLLVKRKLH